MTASTIEVPDLSHVNVKFQKRIKEVQKEAQKLPATGAGATPTTAGFGYVRRFPIEYLPIPMREYALDIAARKQVPVDLPVLTMFGILSGLTGPRILVRGDHDWTQPTNLFVAVGMDTGSAKSPAISELRSGLWLANQTLATKYEQIHVDEIERLRREAEEIRKEQRDSTDMTDAEKRAAQSKAARIEKAVEELEKAERVVPAIDFDGDTTPEALSEAMAANRGFATIIDSEGTLLSILGGQYAGGKTANLGVFLKAYDCDSYRPSRVTRKAAAIPRAALSVAISPQPGLIGSMLRNQMMSEVGFINRFIVCMPGDLVGKREDRESVHIDDMPPSSSNGHMRHWWERLLNEQIRYDVIPDGKAEEDAPTIDLDRPAHAALKDYVRTFEARMDASRDGDLSKAKGWAAKHCARVLRIAALLHLAHGFSPDDRIEADVMVAAIGIGEWTIEHFMAAGNLSGLSEDAAKVAEYIRGHENHAARRSEINERVFGNRGGKLMDSILAELSADEEFEVVKKKSGGRPTEYVLLRGVGRVPE